LNRVISQIRLHSILLAGLLLSLPIQALETDQFYAWGKPIKDSTVFLNAWVSLQFQSDLESRGHSDSRDCESVVNDVQSRLQHSIYQPIELWIISSKLVDRIPRGLEATRDYRSNYLLSNTYTFDHARTLQPSPTLQVNEIRFGSDKLAHFFSEGWWYYKHWKKNRDKLSAEELQRSMFEFGVKLEKSIQGTATSGVFSPADLEANYQGFRFYHRLCHTDDPLLYRKDGRWHFSDSFDFRDYIYPEWDETWNPNVYSPRRWRGVRSTMAGYCTALDSAWVNRQRKHYASLDKLTSTEILVQELVDNSEIPDPRNFDIISVCGRTESE
jgi:hypothetical protein